MSNNSDFTNNMFGDIFGDYFNAYKQTGRYRDDGMLEVALRKKEFEEHLDKMWRIYSTGNVSQIVEYNKQVESIKQCGYKVMRNSAGSHKLVLTENN